VKKFPRSSATIAASASFCVGLPGSANRKAGDRQKHQENFAARFARRGREKKSIAGDDRCDDCVYSASRRNRGFATGGIGGVHRGDLRSGTTCPELAATPITVVLFGRENSSRFARDARMARDERRARILPGCDEMPAFYSRRSGLLSTNESKLRAKSPSLRAREMNRKCRTRFF